MKKFHVPINRRSKEEGFTRVDLLAAVAGLLLLVGLVWPVMAASNDDSQRQVCQSNLKNIGLAFHAWSEAHGQRMPWRVGEADGGAYGLTSARYAWVHFFYLTNDLKSPKVLACPADEVNVASDWTKNAQGGYLNSRYRASAVSYLVGLDVRNEAPKSILSGDRNLQFTARNQFCDYANVKRAASLDPNDQGVHWKNSIHLRQGNLLFMDGSVLGTDSEELRDVLAKTKAAHQENHVLPSR